MKTARPDFRAVRDEISAEKVAAAEALARRAAVVAGLVAPAAIVAAAPAAAQSIDYGSFETLFGEPVTASATGTPQRASEAPVSMEIISAEDIRNSGATDLATLLSRVPGVNVQRPTRSGVDIGVRGYNQLFSNRLLVLVNGRQVFLDPNGMTQWELIPVQLEEIRQIEIVKGPNTALFGFNAVGGVVNIITFNALHDDVDTVKTSLYNDGSSQGSLVYTFRPHEKVGVRLSAGASAEEEFEAFNIPERSGRRAYSGEVKVQVAPKILATVESTFSNIDLLGGQPGQVFTYDTWEGGSIRGQVDAEGGFGLLSVSAYQNTLNVGFNRYGGSSPWIVDSTLNVFKVEDLFKVGARHTFRVAAEYRTSETTMGSATTPSFVDEVEVTSFSGMWNWAVTDTVSTTLALRRDEQSASGESVAGRYLGGPQIDEEMTEYSYNAGLVWKATDKDTLKFQAARGLQSPSVVEYWDTPSVEASIVNNYGVDYDRALSAINGVLKASVFYQVNEDMRVEYYTPALPNFPFAAAWGDSDLFGAELGLEGKIGDHFDWRAAYTHLEVEDKFDPAFLALLGDAPPVNYEGSTPTSEAKLGASYSLAKWRLSADARYVGERTDVVMPAPGTPTVLYVPVDSYVGLDLRAAYKVQDGVVIALEGQDITNDGDPETARGAKDSQYRISLTIDF